MRHSIPPVRYIPTNAPLWLAAAMAVVGMIAITHVDPGRTLIGDAPPAPMRIVVNDQAYASSDEGELTYPDAQMVLDTRTGDGGFLIYRNRNQGGGGGPVGTAAKSVPPNLIFIKTGANTYLPLVPVKSVKLPAR